MNINTQQQQPGTPDPDFPPIEIPNPVANERNLSAEHLITLADGRLIVGCQNSLYRQGPCLVRINADDSLDTSFGQAGYAFINLAPHWSVESGVHMLRLHRLSDGRLLARLECIATVQERRVTCQALVQFTADGQPDLTFGQDGQRVYLLPGHSPQQPEQSPPPDAPAQTQSARFPFLEYGDLQLLPDGKILLLNSVRDLLSSSHRAYVTRLLATGELDPTFNDNGWLELITHTSFAAFRVLAQTDGMFLISGEHPGIPFIARFTEDGTLDLQFGEQGYYTDFGLYAYSSFFKLLPTADGHLLVTGQRGGRTFIEGRGVVAISKIDINGQRVPDFNGGQTILIEPQEPDDAVLYAFDVIIDSAQRTVIAGRQISANPTARIDGFLTRLLENGQPDTSVGEHGTCYYSEIAGVIEVQQAPDTAHYYASALMQSGQPERIYRLLA